MTQLLSRDEMVKLARIDKCHPLTLVQEVETRRLLEYFLSVGIYTIQPEARAAITAALEQSKTAACPIMPATNFETVAYADELDRLECIADVTLPNPTNPSWPAKFSKGRKYPIHTGSYRFTDKFTRRKMHFDEQTKTQHAMDHDCTRSGQDRYIEVKDDSGYNRRFMDRPERPGFDFEEAQLWEIFHKPEVKTIAERHPELVDQNLAVLRSCEMLAGYEYYPGQRTYLSRVAAKDCGLIAAATGVGKTLCAISLLAMKGPTRALIIAPQGTMRSSKEDAADEFDEDGEEGTEFMNASQWIKEINRFAPYLQIWEIFSYEDYQRICSVNGGKLPPGVYVSYYQAMFQNGGRETAPQSWNDEKLNQWAKTNGFSELELTGGKRYWCDTVGQERNGIRCIMEPCLATRIGHEFDGVFLDEAHVCCNLSTNVSQMMIRLQPKYRYAFTATPIPNIISNLFSLMGWLSVPEWYKGKRRNAAWPYAREEIGKFNDTFLSMERDHTQEMLNRRADPHWRGKCTRVSPVISSPARLLKLLKPTMAFISKEGVNPDYRPPKLVDVRVPLGREQAKLYEFYLDRGNIPAKHPLIRARKQTAWLRGICADPAHFAHGGEYTPKVKSNMNPKVISILELTRDLLMEGEQVLIINSRVGLTDTIQDRLVEAGVSIARIDSTISPEQHAYQANLFKKRKTMVMLMGLKCAASYSFEQCKYTVIGSIEYSPGPLSQACGRTDRVNSRPGVTIYCILTKDSIEEVMYDTTCTKDDAATICLKGKRVPRNFIPVDASEILVNAIEKFDISGATPESECEQKWPQLRDAIRASVNGWH